jgi:uncharacterized DUF497 family protein
LETNKKKLRKHGVLFEHDHIESAALAKLTQKDTNAYDSHRPLALGKLKDGSGFVAVYIDDIIVFSTVPKTTRVIYKRPCVFVPERTCTSTPQNRIYSVNTSDIWA